MASNILVYKWTDIIQPKCITSSRLALIYLVAAGLKIPEGQQCAPQPHCGHIELTLFFISSLMNKKNNILISKLV